MRLITLLAGYAAGLAVAMKYRKDSGKSKLESDPNKSKVDAFFDEVVDIHKSAYTEVKDFVVTNFDDVKDGETLKAKVASLLDTALSEAETLMAKLREKGTTKKEALEKEVDTFFEEKEALLDQAKEKSTTFADTATDGLTRWIDQAKLQLAKLHEKVRGEISHIPPNDTPAKKSPSPKSTPKKSSPPKE